MQEKGKSGHTGFCVTLEAQHDFRCPVPPGSHVFGHVSRIFLRVHGETSSQAKIANLELAVCVHEEITGFEISVEDVCGMYELQATQDLVDEGLEMGISQWLAGSDDGGQVAFHEFWHSISGLLSR